MLDWLATPIDPGRAHDLGMHIAWHGRFMVLAWSVLVPLGIIAARFFKVLPTQDWPRELDSRVWWWTHRACQYSAALIVAIAVVVVLTAPDRAAYPGIHYIFGWTVALLTALQVTAALLRGDKGGPTAPGRDGSLRGHHYDMTRRRIAFEMFHKTAGYTVLLIAVFATLTGLWQANGPRWMWIVIPGWWLALAGLFVLFSKQGRVVDTYQAIWGPDAVHPGNQRPRRVRPPRPRGRHGPQAGE